MLSPDAPMFSRQLQHAGRTRRFLIVNREGGGWEVREEDDRQVVRQVLYNDWHRVERARTVFAQRVMSLQEEGWTEVVEGRRFRVGGR
jgi:hypothetical protein